MHPLDDPEERASGLPLNEPPHSDRVRWALHFALCVVRQRSDVQGVVRARVVEGIEKALRQIAQREALLDTLVELHLEVARLQVEQRHNTRGSEPR